MKSDTGKPDYTLVPPQVIDAIEAVREYGVAKYSDPLNWQTVSYDRYWKAILRHVRAAWNDPTKLDEESGLPHLWHIACNIAFMIAMGEQDETQNA